MWVDYIRVNNLMIATMWKDVLEGEGLPAKIIPEGDILSWGDDYQLIFTANKKNSNLIEILNTKKKYWIFILRFLKKNKIKTFQVILMFI